MAISRKRLSEFEKLGFAGMARWIETAALRYFCETRNPDAFSPFELFIGTAESTATDIRRAYGRLSMAGQADFRAAVEWTLSSLEGRPDLSEVWKFLIELSWQLPEPRIVKVLETRFNENFLDNLCANDPDLFNHIFGYILNTTPYTTDAARCIRNLVRSSHYDDHFSRQTLLRLCEIDPDNWTQHFGLLRDSLYRSFAHIREADPLESETDSLVSMIRAQDELARDIIGVTGFERLVSGLFDLHLLRDAPVGPPSDNWFWRCVFEREEFVIIDRATLALSPQTNPNERRTPPFLNRPVHPPPLPIVRVSSIYQSRDSIPSTDAMNADADLRFGKNWLYDNMPSSWLARQDQ